MLTSGWKGPQSTGPTQSGRGDTVASLAIRQAADLTSAQRPVSHRSSQPFAGAHRHSGTSGPGNSAVVRQRSNTGGGSDGYH
jgi:hypothetical protein